MALISMAVKTYSFFKGASDIFPHLSKVTLNIPIMAIPESSILQAGYANPEVNIGRNNTSQSPLPISATSPSNKFEGMDELCFIPNSGI